MADRTEYFQEYNKQYRQKNLERVKSLHSAWRLENKEKRNAYMRKWHAEKRAADPVTHAKNVRKNVLKRRYGITPEDYDRMLSAQGGHCALCNRAPDQERYGTLHVDHCHETGRVRGLLCHVHNTALGKLGDNEAGLLRVLAYVKGGV